MVWRYGPLRKPGSPGEKGNTEPVVQQTGVTLSGEASAAANEERVYDTPPIVGVGASAGGLEALTELLSHLPGDTGLSFVLIQHLDPNHESHLRELLSKASAMAVSEVQAETRVEANHVYVISPQYNLSISAGILKTQPRPDAGRNMPVDSFLRALAVDVGSKALGVVLSGTGSDGTLGLGAIKAAGGVTFAQERKTAKFDGMPESAIAARVVDFVLPPSVIAQQLVAIAHGYGVPGEPVKAGEPSEGTGLNKIIRLLRTTTGVDFTFYKHSTLERRIKRRMALRGFTVLADYSRDLEQNHEEAKILCESIFITVTAFFREPVIEELKRTVFPALVENNGRDGAIRIWVPGCSTGEEAYSIAICLMEFLDGAKLNLPFEVFATDISETAIEIARNGKYTDASMSGMSPQRLIQFFTRSEGGYQITKAVRDVCVFARHNVAQDPPISKLDLISCCNVLIYLGTELQLKVLSILHYALKPSGFLVLGPSEGIGACADLFHQVHKTDEIYRPIGDACGYSGLQGAGKTADDRLEIKRTVTALGRAGPDVQREADRLVLAEHGPPGAVIDDEMNIVQVRGRTAQYLELASGEPTYNILKMAREGLIAGVGKAIRAARESNAPAKENGFRIESHGQLKEVAIKVIPFAAASSPKERYFLVLFDEAGRNGNLAADHEPLTSDGAEGAQLRRELAATKEYLQSVVDDKVSTLEELRAANEEAQAGNEELQTAQEELESANEELNTLNENLKTSNVELSHVNRDLTNLLESISIPLVMVGRDLRIRRFTRDMEPMLNLIASDVGRSITDLQPQVQLPDLRQLLLSAMDGGNRKPLNIRDANGRWYLLRILPSVGQDRKIDGAVLMLIDIDAAKRGLDFAEAIVETVREPLVILNQNLQVIQANKSFYETFKTARKETEGRRIYDLGDGQWNIPKLRELLEDILPAHSPFFDFEVTHHFERVGRKVMVLNATEIFSPNAQARTILLAIEDATDRKHAEEALQATNAELQHFAYALTHDLQEPLRMVVNFTELLGREYKGRLDEDADTFISYAIEGALRIEAMLKALLAYWEVTEREQDSFTLVDCNAVLSKALFNLQVAIEESGASVTSDPLPTLAAEEVVLIQVLQNLISNSIKYRGEKAPKINVSAERNAEGWLFSVQDDGIGMDPEDRERIFGMFKRLHGSEIPGTGIGLALCRKVVERQGGLIWVESEKGRGATFKFTIPGSRKELRAGRES